MEDLIPINQLESKKNQTQSRLMIIAGLIIITYAVILTLAPSIRNHSDNETCLWGHWLGVIVWVVVFSILHRLSINKLSKRDPYLLPIVALLSAIGLMTIWRLYPNLGLRQSIWLALSALVVIAGIQFPGLIDSLRRYKYIWLISGLLLTALTIFLGSNPSGNGPTLWLNFLGIHFQPSEILKLVLVAYLAGYFTDRISVTLGEFEGVFPHLIVTGIALLLLVFQRDLGTASIFLMLYLAMLYATRGEKLILWLTPLLILILGLVGYHFLDIVKIRIDTWLNPLVDPTGTSYQIIQSIMAIAEGNLIGTGVGLGSPNLIPVAVSDFIFSAIAEEMGFLGATLIILLIIIFLYRCTKIVIATQNSFHRYLALGLIFYFGIQSIFIIGGNIGLLPLTGVTLPFVSYGGSSLLTSFIAFLILWSISNQIEDEGKPTQINHPRLILINGLMMVVLLGEILTTSLISFWLRNSLVDRPDNPRWVIDDRYSPRGDILDRDNQIIITNTEQYGQYERTSNHIPLYPVVGYTDPLYGQTGIEASMFSYLRGYEGYPFKTQFWHDLIYNQPPEGLDVRLTLDLDLQKKADELLTNAMNTAPASTAILMNANSGEILVMASHPYFDAGILESRWEDLIKDQNAPLINRAAQGKYPPGSALLPFIAGSQIDLIQQHPDPATLLPSTDLDLDCARSVGNELTWQNIISNGCQNVQFELGKISGVDLLLNIYKNFGFFSEPNLSLDVADADTPIISEETTFYYGGGFNISPLQMALALSAFSNDGILPEPRIVNAYQDSNGKWNTLPSFDESEHAISPIISSQLTRLLKSPDTAMWQVTALATNEEDEPITWFLGGTSTDWQGEPIVVVIVLEAEAPELAESIGEALMEEAILLSN
ncbi:MAG: FtsW/RodA/SpoVE family cell cycle protein [Chloroflexota bacterium]|nr:FtsW/RodA/SpoVE family cell cycle protein [Chloroflexota bacterium]